MHNETDVFAAFENVSNRPWNPHPKFTGVALKHLLAAADTGGKFSYHLVRIASGCAIGSHVHETQLETHEVIAGEGMCVNSGMEVIYRPGIVTVFKPDAPHEIRAGAEGLRLFAKFMPALC